MAMPSTGFCACAKNAVPMIASDKNVALSVVVIFLILFMAANYRTTVAGLHLIFIKR